MPYFQPRLSFLKPSFYWWKNTSYRVFMLKQWGLAYWNYCIHQDPGVVHWPRGFYCSTYKWIIRQRLKFWCKQPSYQVLYPRQRNIQTPPKTLDSVERTAPWQITALARPETPTIHVSVIPQGRLYGPSGDVLTADGYILTDSSLLFPNIVHRECYKHPIFQQLSSGSHWPVLKQLEGIICGLASQYAVANYFHWLFNVLPRLDLIQKAGFSLDDIDTFVVNELRLPFQKETLEVLGIPSHKLLEADNDFYGIADTLIATSTLRISGHRSSWAHSFLRQAFLSDNQPHKGRRRLYISRDDASSRRLLNESECFSYLASLGFEKVVMSGRSIQEQATLFASAEAIVALHGAALTNLVFCSPGTQIIELFPPTWPRAYYWELSNCARLEYGYLIGKLDKTVTQASTTQHDFLIPLNQLRELLATLNIQ